ncbi:uncharacterized protein LOC143028068 [Oratosquilla oratoria]|uniref:uncharacterized protein LOC143028068 n=1 Tax=Oratosquilla oratoria TaxID=337810 RepID=UPI003F765865
MLNTFETITHGFPRTSNSLKQHFSAMVPQNPSGNSRTMKIVYRQTPEERDDNRSQETETSSGSSVTFGDKKSASSGDQHSKENQDMSFTASQNETGENPGCDDQPSHQGGTKHTSARECGVLTELNRRDIGRVKGGEQNNQEGDKRTKVLEKNNAVRDSQGGVRKNGVGPEEDKENLGVQEECTIHTARKENKDVALTREKKNNGNVPKKEECNKMPPPEEQDTTKSIHCTQNSAEINSEDKNLLSCGEDIVGEIKQNNDSEHQIRKDNGSEHLSSKEDGEYSSRNEEDDVKGREEGRKTHRVRFEMDNKDKVPEMTEAIVKGWRIFGDESAGDLEAGQKTSSPVKPRRYSLRRSTRKSYAEIPLPADDDFIFCDDCDREWEGECLFHSLTLIFDRQVARDGSVPDRARQTVPWPLSINTSKVPGAGLGVWTNADLPPRLVFGPYEGRLLQETQTPGTESGYGWRIRGHSGISCVDAEDPSVSNWMRYVNCSRNLRETNLAAFQYQGQIYYRTVTHINRGAELMVWYGDDYARELGINRDETSWMSGYTTGADDYSNRDDNVNKGSPSMERDARVALRASNTKTCVDIARLSCERRWRGKENAGDVDSNTPTECVNVLNTDICMNKEENDLCTEPANIYNDDICISEDIKDDQQVSEIDNLRNQTRTHASEILCKCTECGYQCTNPEILKAHARIHAPEFVCEQQFSEIGDLKSHARVHTGEKPYECKQCGRRFTHLGSLKNHTRVHTGEKPYECEQCGRRFTQLGNLKIHTRVHTGEKPYDCKQCGRRFTEIGHLKRHTRIHTGEKPYECKQCGRRFTLLGHLKSHTRLHTGEKPYECKQCGRRFTQLGSLKSHTRVHTGEKPYECKQCGRRFTQLGSLKSHTRVHTGEKPYECKQCGQRFTQLGHLKRHKCSFS